MSGWSYAGEPAALGSAGVTLVEGSSFCVCETSGDVRDGTPQGVFFQDTRIVSRWTVTLDGDPVESLAAVSDEPWRATFLGRGAPRQGHLESTLLLRRERYIGQGMREDLVLENLAGEPAAVRIEVTCDADFADLFEVKESRVPPRPRPDVQVVDGSLELVRTYVSRGSRRGVQITSEGAVASTEGLTFNVVIPPRDKWMGCVQVVPIVDERTLSPRFPTDQPLAESGAARRAKAWREQVPVVDTSDRRWRGRWSGARRTSAPCGSSTRRIRTASRRRRRAVVHDAVRPRLAAHVVHGFAAGPGPGARHAADAGALPGRTCRPDDRGGARPHPARGAVRRASRRWPSAAAPSTTARSTRRRCSWCCSASCAAGGWPRSEVDAAAARTPTARWTGSRDYGDRDGDGFVEYQRATDRGLVNQGWKDSWDGITFADGRSRAARSRSCEVQGYVYAAYLARGALRVARPATRTLAGRWRGRAPST